MFIVGQTGTAGGLPNGKPIFGNMSQDQAVAWLTAKDGRGNNIKSNMKTCVSGVMADSGGPGGGNTTYSFDGQPMRHVSQGAGSGAGVTLFYIARPGNVAKIIGIGYHSGAQTYAFTWKEGGWHTVGTARQITLDR